MLIFLLLAYLPMSVYPEISTAADKASIFPKNEDVPSPPPARAVITPPHTVTPMAIIPFLGILPCMNMQKPMAANITSVSTRTVEEAMVVCFNDSNHSVKCSAKRIPAAMAANTSFL